MQTNIELEKFINKVIDELKTCITLFGNVHPKFERFSRSAISIINDHISDMETLLELCRDNLDVNDADIKSLLESVFSDTFSALAQALELVGTLMAYSRKIEKKQKNPCGEINLGEFYYNIPIRQEIEVLPADSPKQLKLGWIVNEKVGFAYAN